MAKFYGSIGFREPSVETVPGVWSPEQVVSRMYYGDVLKASRRYEGNDKVNDDLRLQNQISIVGDPYAREHIFAITYVEWMGARWKVESAEIQSPRILLTLGGVYDG